VSPGPERCLSSEESGSGPPVSVHVYNSNSSIGMKQRPMSVEYNRKSAQPQQVRQVTIDPFPEGDTPDHLRRPKEDSFLSPFSSPSHDQEDSRPPDPIDDLFRRISSLIQTTQGRIIALCTTKGPSEAEIKGKMLDDFAQLSNAIWDAIYRQRTRTEVSPQPREWMRKLLKLEDEKRALEMQARVAIEEATAELQDRLEACGVEISHLRETNAYLEQQNDSFSEQLAVRLKPAKPEAPLKAVRPGVRRLQRELNESIPKALAIARDLSLDSSSSAEPKHHRTNSTNKEAKISPVPRKDQKDRSISPSDRQIHTLKTELERCKLLLQKSKQDKDRLQAWKDSYLRSPPQLTSALQHIEQDNEHEHKKLVGKTLILQHKLNAVQLGAQRFIRVSSSLLRFARDRDAVAQFEDARSELDVLLREIQRESKPGSTSVGATPSGGSPNRFSSLIHTPEKRPEPDRALKGLEKENRRLEDQLQVERKRADTFAEALEVTQREVEALNGGSISPVVYLQQQEHTIRLLKAQLKASSEAKLTESEVNRRNSEVGDQLRRALDQVQVLRTSNNALMQDLVAAKGDLARTKDLFKAEIVGICAAMDTVDSTIQAEFSKKDAALTRLKHSVFNRLQGYESTLVRLNSLFPSPSKDVPADTEEKQHLEYLLQRSEDLSAAKEAELQAFIDQQGGVAAGLQREVEEWKEVAAEVAPLHEKVEKLEAALAGSQALEADNQRLRGELNSCTAQVRQKEASCHQLLYEKHQLDATNAALMDESRTKSEDLLKAQMDFQRVISEANKRMEDLAQTLQATQGELDRTKAAGVQSAAVLGKKKEKLRASRTQSSEESAQLAQELLTLQAELQTCRGSLQAKEQELGTAQDRMGKFAEQEKALEAANQRITVLTAALEANQEEADKERVAAGRLTSELTAARATAEDYSRKAELLAVDKAALKDALESLKAKHELSSKDREERIQDVLSSLLHNQTRIKELEEDLALLIQERDTACLQLQDLQRTTDLLRTEAEEGREIDKKLRETQAQVATLQRTKTGLDSNNERLTAEIQRLVGENKNQKERLDQLAAELAAAQKDKSLGALVTQLQREAEERRQEVEELRQIRQAKELAYSRDLDQSRTELETAGKTLNELKITQLSMKSEKEALENALNGLKAAKEAEISTLTEQMTRSKAAIADLEAEKRRLETDMEKINSVLKEISAASEAAEKENNQIKAQCSQLAAELAQCESSKAAFELESRRLESKAQQMQVETEKTTKEQQDRHKRAMEELTRELQQQISTLSSDHARVSGENSQLRESNEEMEGIIALLQTAKQHLERSNEDLRTQADHCSLQLSTQAAQLAALSTSLQAADSDRDSLLQQLSEARLAARQDRELLQLRIEEIEREGKAARETLTQCKEEISGTETLLKAANERMEQEQRTVSELRREKEGLLGQVTSLNGRLEEAFQQLETASKEQGDQSFRLSKALRETQQRLAETQLQLESRTRDLLQISTHSTQIREEKDRLSTHVSELLTTRDSLQQALDQKEADLRAQATTLQSASSRLQDLESDLNLQLSQFRATLQDSQSKLSTAQAGLEAYRRKAEGLEEECSQLEKELKATEKQGEDAAAERRKLRESVAALESKAAKLGGELNSALQMLGVTRRETAETIDSLQSALKAAKADKEELRVRNEGLENDLRSSRLGRETLEKELAGLREDLKREKSESASRLKSLQSDFFQQSTALTTVHEDLDSQKAELRAASEAWTREKEAANAANSRSALLIAELTATNAALLGQVQTGEREKGELVLEVQRSSGRVGDLEAALKATNSDFKRSCKEVDDLKAALSASEAKVSSLEKERQAALQTIGINRREQAESSEKLQASLKSFRDKSEEWERDRLKLSAEKEKLAIELEESGRNGEKSKRDIEDLERNLAAAKKRVETLETDQNQREISLSALLTAKEGQVHALTGRLEEACKQLQEETRQRSSQGDHLRQDLRAVQQELADALQSCHTTELQLKAEVAIKDQLRAETGKTIADLRDLVQEKDAEVDKQAEIVAKKEQEIVEFQGLFTRISQELANQQIANDSLAMQISALTNQLETIERDLKSEKNRSESLENDLEKGEKERNQLIEQLQKAEISRNQVKTETEAVTKQLNAEIDTLRAEAQQNKQQLQAFLSSNEQLEGLKAELEARIQLQIASFQTSQADFAKEKTVWVEKLNAAQEKSKSLSKGLNERDSELNRLSALLQERGNEQVQTKAQFQQLNSELETALRSKDQLKLSETDLKSQVEDQKSQINSLCSQLEALKTANLAISVEQKRNLELENAISTLKIDFSQLFDAKSSLESQNQSLEQRFASISSQFAAAKAQEAELNELNHYLEAENVKLEKQLADLTESKEALERANTDQETEIARLIEEVRRANSGETGEELVLGSLRSENNLGNLSGLGPMEEEKLSSADSLDLGAAYNAMPRQDTIEEPLESDPPIRVEEGEISPERLIIEDLSGLLEAYRNPQDDLIATVKKLLEEFELMKKNPARNVIPRLNLRSQRESKETQTSPRDDLSLVEELKGSSNADSASVELDKSVGGSEAADQDTPRQKILPELWMKPVAHRIQQAKGSEATALRNKVKSLEQELQEEKTLAEHLNGQNRLLKEEMAEKTRHIKRLEVAESAGEKSPVNIEHLKDVLVKLIMQLPKQAANAETLINTIFSVLFLTPQDVQHIEDARKGIKKKLFGLFK